MKLLRKIRNYFCYCGIEKEEYAALKRDVYISNFEVWRILHFLMFAAFAFLFIESFISSLLATNRLFYGIALAYTSIVICAFFLLKKDSLFAQLLIYCSITMLFLFGALITQNKPDTPAATFFVFLLIMPMLMIDKPYFMSIELLLVAIGFSIWMYNVKPYDIWQYDFLNIIVYTLVGIFLHIIATSVRIKEFVLRRKINIQKDLDDSTGLKNKGALTREINSFLMDSTKTKGILFLLDIDYFKSINDTYGHDVGDSVIRQFGTYLGEKFSDNNIVGRFGGDEFIVFMKNTNDLETATKIAAEVVDESSKFVKLPDETQFISVSIGIALYTGHEKNYSEIFKKADVSLYKIKADRSAQFHISL